MSLLTRASDILGIALQDTGKKIEGSGSVAILPGSEDWPLKYHMIVVRSWRTNKNDQPLKLCLLVRLGGDLHLYLEVHAEKPTFVLVCNSAGTVGATSWTKERVMQSAVVGYILVDETWEELPSGDFLRLVVGKKKQPSRDCIHADPRW